MDRLFKRKTKKTKKKKKSPRRAKEPPEDDGTYLQRLSEEEITSLATTAGVERVLEHQEELEKTHSTEQKILEEEGEEELVEGELMEEEYERSAVGEKESVEEQLPSEEMDEEEGELELAAVAAAVDGVVDQGASMVVPDELSWDVLRTWGPSELREQLHKERKLRRKECKVLEGLKVQHQSSRAQLGELGAVVEKLMSHNTALEHELQSVKQQREGERERLANVDKDTRALRELVMKSMQRKNTKRRRGATERLFWEKLATPEVLALSEPVSFFPISKPEQRVLNSRLQELEHEVASCKRREELLSKGIRERDETLRKMAKLPAQMRLARKEVDRAQKYALGAVRRIHWLLERERKLKEDNAFKEKYISKLEAKLVKMDKMVKQTRRKHRIAAAEVVSQPQSSSSEAIVEKGAYSYWDTKEDEEDEGQIEEPTRAAPPARDSTHVDWLGTHRGRGVATTHPEIVPPQRQRPSPGPRQRKARKKKKKTKTRSSENTSDFEEIRKQVEAEVEASARAREARKKALDSVLEGSRKEDSPEKQRLEADLQKMMYAIYNDGDEKEDMDVSWGETTFSLE